MQIGLLGSVFAIVVVAGLALLASGGDSGEETNVAARPTATRTTATPGTATAALPGASSTPPKAATATAVPAPTTYTVKAGDSATQIARNLGVKDEDLSAWLRDFAALNGDANSLQVGQVVKLPAAGAGSTAAAPGSTGSSSGSGSGSGSGSSIPTPSAQAVTSTAAPPATSTTVGTVNTAVPTSTTAAAPANTPPAPTATPNSGPPPSLTLSPTRATAGTVMTMTLQNFPPSSEVSVCFVMPDNYRDCGGVDVDQNGYFSAPGDPLAADITDYPGTYRMEATGPNGTFASAPFEIY